MTPTPFHLGWFMNFTPDEWNEPFGAGGSPWTGDFYIEFAQALERACFDYIMIEDTLMVSDAYGGSFDTYLKHALMVPKHDPSPLAAIMAAATRRLGVVATMSTSFYPPFMLARLCSTLDHIARGRFGWNVVTSGEDGSAHNFGMDKLWPREVRYAMAHEYLDLVCELWESWEPEAIVLDRDSGTYADASKVHEINFEGEYFKSRGPLNTVRSPQGKPTIVQAGGSPAGRDFAAKHADSIIATATGIEGMTEYRDDVRSRAEGHGRKADDVKVLFLVSPIVADTTEEAYAKRDRIVASPHYVEQSLAGISSVTDIDFSQFDLDAELPRLTTNGEQGSLDKFAQWGSGKTLRELVMDRVHRSFELIGTPDDVADAMGAAIDEIGGDGYLITAPTMRVSRRYINDITDGLVPALQRRGLTRTAYAHEHLRDTLLEF
jgi:long-chain alkane monooxygenase